ncbi:MAG: ImmA/IrrE family metallo-endopeptidase [Fimbriimonadaceae bacterium]
MSSGRKMPGLDRFLDYRVSKLIALYQENRRADLLPIDLAEIARYAGVHSIDEQEMIPEAVLQVRTDGFRIVLQNNFLDQPGRKTRQRFSLAHELGHILFFDADRLPPKPLKDAPTGDHLEVACHQAASLLLLPSNLLKTQISQFADFPRLEHLVQLAIRFDVSVEVLLRRLNQMGYFNDPQRTVALVRGPDERIEYAICPDWLLSGGLISKPERGRPFADWFSPEGSGQIRLKSGIDSFGHKRTLSARRLKIGASSSTYEIEFIET